MHLMSTNSSPIENWTQRLLDCEAHDKPSHAQVDEAVRVCDKLRVPLSKLIGVAGFQVLLSRALVLAKAEDAALMVLQVQTDGSLMRLDKIEQHQDGAAAKAGMVLVAQLLALLITFIGEPLTLRILLGTWPEVSIDSIDLKNNEAKS